MGAGMTTWSERRWDVWARGYDLLVRRLSSGRRRAVELASLRSGERVLIPGAGTGLDIEHLPHDVRVTALEQSLGMIAILRKRALHRPLHIIRGDATALPFGERSFDCVLLHLIVAVVDEPAAALREAARVLANDGRIVVFDKFAPDTGSIPLIRRLVNPLTRAVATDITLRLAPIAEGAGLEIVGRESGGALGFFQIAVLRLAASEAASRD